ncbi:MAG: cell division protein ZipA C-terminal FtsZ-binding domain-containing protein [Sulfurisoma sp.]|nr:cell division protein ZipA C-terminal FtsZ-binding domain-containing protein [Sulfurisoma sp.]
MAISDLQIALIGVGAAGVGGVWAYNKWQERKHRQLAERILHGGEQTDVLLGSAEADRVVTTTDADERIEPGERVEPVPLAAAEVSPVVNDQPDSPWADPIADGIARLEFAEPLPAPALWAAQAEWAGHLTKPLHWVAQTGSEWRLLTAHDAGRYSIVVAAQQLADRRGAVTEGELTLFVDGAHHLAARLAGVATVPDAGELLAHARALDEFCALVDVQLSINIADPGGMASAGTKLRGLAEAAGMTLDDDGRYHARDDDGNTLYTLGNLGVELFDADSLRSLAAHGITLTLDVPNVAQGPRVFDRMVATARQFAQGLGGVLVDAQHAPLTDAMIAGIRGKIEEIQTRMAARQIVAGSARARRLFS